MSRNALNITPAAEADLGTVYSFYGADAADTIIDQIEKVSNDLTAMPLMGRARPELASDIRSILAGPYTIYYRSESSGVEIVRVIHQSRDVRPEMFD